MTNFVKKRNFDAENGVQIRKMRIFQAIVTERFPQLHSASFDKKVSDFEKKWEKDFVEFADSKALHNMFGIGLQVWIKKTKPDGHHVNRKVFDTIYKNKVRIIIDSEFSSERIEKTRIIDYVFDEVALHFFSCPNKNCFFGSDRYDQFLIHKNSCTTESTVKYAQVKLEKPGFQTRQELADEGILPDIHFQNFFFSTFDIGK